MSTRDRPRRTLRSQAAVMAAATAIGAAGAVGLGLGAGAGAATELIPAKTLPGATTSTSSTTSTTSAATSAPEIVDTGSPLPARASLSQLAAALRPIVGPTDDFTADVGRIIDLPDGIPTPAGAQIEGVEVEAHATGDFEVTVDLRSPALADDVALFYEASMVESGYVVCNRSINPQVQSQELTFVSIEDDGDGECALDKVSVGVADGDDHIAVTISGRSTGSPLEAYVGWTTGLSALDGGVADAVVVALSAGDASGVFFNTTYRYDSDRAADVAADIRASLPTGGFSIDEEPAATPGSDPGTVDEIPLRNALLDDTRIVVSSGAFGAVVVVSGSLALSR